jgi:microcystin-dependent protein
MAEPFLGEIRMASFNFPPKGWAFCNGQLLPIQQNAPLFSRLGTIYGGDGQTTFKLPDLRGRVPIHQGHGRLPGNQGGARSHTLNVSQLATHLHLAVASNARGTLTTPTASTYLGISAAQSLYADAAPGTLVNMALATLTSIGGSQAHENMQPYLAITFIICMSGIFPSEN